MSISTNKKLKKKIEKKIYEIGEYANKNKAVILTETDIQCILYNKLLEIDILSRLEKTKNKEDIYTHYVHTEMSWFDSNGKLAFRPDISLIKPNCIELNVGNRDFIFDGSSIIMEIKLNRSKSSTKFIKEIKGDLEKFKKLKETSNDIFCFFIMYDKRKNVNNDFFCQLDLIDKMGEDIGYKLIYLNEHK